MRIFESLLKILFLILGVYFVWTHDISSSWFTAFLVINLLLGMVLMLNDHHPSYKYPKNYKKNARVLAMRKFEGIVMISFVMYVLYIAR